MYDFFLLWRCDPTRVMASSFLRFLDHTQRRTTVGRTPLDEWSAPRRDLYLTKQNTHNRQTSMTPVGFEPTISAGERPQTYALDRAATGTGKCTNTGGIWSCENDRCLVNCKRYRRAGCVLWIDNALIKLDIDPTKEKGLCVLSKN